MKTILHSDVNNFFASVECATRQDLKDKPVAVTGNPEKRTGIILAKNEIAKKFGVKTGMSIFEAKQYCPELVCLAPHYSLYEEISLKLHELYLDYTDLVEPMGLDECWLDVTSSMKILNKTALQIANEIRERVKKEFGFTVSVGVSFNKIYAKLGSDLKKPDAVTEIPKEEFKNIAFPLPLNSIVGIGKRLEKKFLLMNVKTIGDFCALKDSYIKQIWGIVGLRLKANLMGSEEEKVKNYFDAVAPKSIGNGTTTIKDILKRDEIEKVVAFLAEKISKRLIKSGYQARTIHVSLKDNEFKKYSKSKTISACFASNVIIKEVMSLIDSFYDYSHLIRAIRISCGNLENISNHKQMSFFDQRQENASRTIEKIVNKYGQDSIVRASEFSKFINRKNHTEE